MNKIDQCDVTYITPNKTIEAISISNGEKKRNVYLYNYKGVSHRVFKSKEKMDGFWKGQGDEDLHFETEQELDEWLINTVTV